MVVLKYRGILSLDCIILLSGYPKITFKMLVFSQFCEDQVKVGALIYIGLDKEILFS